MLAGSSESPYVPAGALLYATALGSDAITPALGALNAGADPVVAMAAWRVLQQLGGSEALSEMESLAPGRGDDVGDAAAFALSVVGARVGSGDFAPATPDASRLLAIPADGSATTTAIEVFAAGDADFELMTRSSSIRSS